MTFCCSFKRGLGLKDWAGTEVWRGSWDLLSLGFALGQFLLLKKKKRQCGGLQIAVLSAAARRKGASPLRGQEVECGMGLRHSWEGDGIRKIGRGYRRGHVGLWIRCTWQQAEILRHNTEVIGDTWRGVVLDTSCEGHWILKRHLTDGLGLRFEDVNYPSPFLTTISI